MSRIERIVDVIIMVAMVPFWLTALAALHFIAWLSEDKDELE